MRPLEYFNFKALMGAGKSATVAQRAGFVAD
jgi:hypothetical protein